MLRKSLQTLALCLLLAATASAQVTFERKLPESTTTKSEIASRTVQKLTIAGMEIPTESQSRQTVSTTTGKRDAGGNLKSTSQTENLQITINIQGSEYVFDSANPDKTSGSALEIMRPLHKGSLQRKTTTTLNNENRVVQVEYDPDPLNGLDENLRKLVQNQFDLEKIKESVNQELDRFPSEPVKVGDVWERTSKMNLEAGQSLTLTTKYKYLGEAEVNGKKVDQIETVVQTVEYNIAADGGFPLGLKSSNLKSKDSKGLITYDRKLGRVTGSKSTLNVGGEITFSANGQEIPAALELTIESSTELKQ